MRRCTVAIAAILLGATLPIAGTSYAFDGQREGFMVGLGLGGGYCSGGQPDLPWRSNEGQNQFGGAYEGRIGFSASRLSLFVEHRGGTFSSNSMGVTGLGVAYYLSDHAPGLYLTGIMGVSNWN